MKGGTCQFVESTGAEITRPVRETRRGGKNAINYYITLNLLYCIILWANLRRIFYSQIRKEFWLNVDDYNASFF